MLYLAGVHPPFNQRLRELGTSLFGLSKLIIPNAFMF